MGACMVEMVCADPGLKLEAKEHDDLWIVDLVASSCRYAREEEFEQQLPVLDEETWRETSIIRLNCPVSWKNLFTVFVSLRGRTTM